MPRIEDVIASIRRIQQPTAFLLKAHFELVFRGLEQASQVFLPELVQSWRNRAEATYSESTTAVFSLRSLSLGLGRASGTLRDSFKTVHCVPAGLRPWVR